MTSPANTGIRRFSAPANILIAGEYLVTRDGGTGLCCAVQPRGFAELELNAGCSAVTVRSRTSSRPESGTNRTSRFPDDTYPETTSSPLVRSVLQSVQAHSRQSLPPGTRITIDTSAFFDSSGRKRGFGSSAVAAVLLTTAALDATHPDSAEPDAKPQFDPALICRLATDAHRRANGGRGSGYDVATSTFGGWGIFTRSGENGWRRIEPGREIPDGLCLYTADGPEAVETSAAVARFEAWTRANPDKEERWRAQMAVAVNLLASGTDWNRFYDGWKSAATAGRELGDAIGVPVKLHAGVFSGTSVGGDAIDPDRAPVIKASGAGDERLIIALPTGRTPPEGWRRLRFEGDGVRRENSGGLFG